MPDFLGKNLTLIGAIYSYHKERQFDGIQKAKENGVQLGRKPKLSGDQISEMQEKRIHGVLIKDIMKEYGLSKASVYRLLKSN